MANNISILTFNSSVLANATYTSEKCLLGHYNSLSVIGKSQTSVDVFIEYSGDGTNWDYYEKFILSTTNNLYVSSVVGKWVRLRIVSTTASSYVRCFVYGNYGSAGGSVSSIDETSTTAFGEELTAGIKPEVQYIFTKGTTGTYTTAILPYSDIKYYSSKALNNYTIGSGVVRFGNGCTSVGDKMMLYGGTYRYRPGQGINSKFTAYFTQGPKSNPQHPTTEYVGIGNINGTSVLNGYFFGYGDPSAGVTSFGIIYINNSVRTFYPSTSWNVDKCDGTNVMPLIDFSKTNIYKITFQYLGFGIVRFYIENPLTGDLTLVHTIQRVNTVNYPSNMSDPTVGFVMFIEVESGVIENGGTSEVGSCCFNLSIEGDSTPSNDTIGSSINDTGITSTESAIITYSCPPVFYGSTNYYPIDINHLSIATDGTKNIVVNAYLNSTFSVSPVFGDIGANLIPISSYVGGTITSFGTLLFSTTLAKADTLTIKPLGLLIQPRSYITFTAKVVNGSSTSTVTLATSFSIH